MYSETGSGPAWNVRVRSRKFSGMLVYLPQLRRFTRGHNTMRCRRGAPKAFAAALALVESSFLPGGPR